MAKATKQALSRQPVPVSVTVVDLKIKMVPIPITGISPLIIHAWSEKSMRMIADKQAGKAKNTKHEIRDPEAEWKAARHIAAAGWEGYPAAGFKAAIIRAAKIVGMVMKDTQTAFFINADCEKTQLVKIKGKSEMHMAMVRVGIGASDIRYRPIYNEWGAVLNIEYNQGILSLDQVHQLVKVAGYGCGIGEMRPEKGKFSYGRFKLANEK